MQLLPTVPDELLRGNEYDSMRIRAYLDALRAPFAKGKYGLLSVGKDVKTIKGEKYGIRTGVLYLAPADLSGHEVCNSRTKGCTAVCLFTSGHGAYKKVKQARLRKTMVYAHRRKLFMKQLHTDILNLKVDAASKGMQPAVRLNGTSDINWVQEPVFDMLYEHIFDLHPDVQFYDYTKRIEILEDALGVDNYHLTFSRAETKKNHIDCEVALDLGYNLTVVFGKKLPPIYMDYPVVDGDRHDVRFWDTFSADDGPVVIGLKAKGKARLDKESGFVIWEY